MNFYNEFDEFKCEWIQNLKGSGEIPEGTIDGRSITEVEAAELVGYHQCHFFTGIAGWPKALQLAGYGGTAGIWTGSPPCQPFSVAGKRKGEKDKRHLWPEFRRLIAQCKPSIVFIEQVASKDGREWFARVRSDFEDLGYRVGAADLCGACIGAPHIRQRLYIGAVRIRDTNVVRQDPVGGIQERSGADGAGGVRGVRMADTGCFSDAGRGISLNMDSPSRDAEGKARQRKRMRDAVDDCGAVDRMADNNLDGRTSSRKGERETWSHEPERRREPDRLAYSSSTERNWWGEPEREQRESLHASDCSRADRLANTEHDARRSADVNESRRRGPAGSTSPSGPWSDFRIIDCLDGKKRRVGTGIQPLAHGIPRGLGQSQSELRTMVRHARSNRKGRLKGYGDAIVVPLAAMFITELFKALDHD